jgi:hypothetical protein
MRSRVFFIGIFHLENGSSAPGLMCRAIHGTHATKGLTICKLGSELILDKAGDDRDKGNAYRARQ